MTDRTAIIAGSGSLPAALVAASVDAPLVCALDGFDPVGLVPDHRFRVEGLNLFLDWLQERAVTRLVFAGAITRPRLDPARLDPGMARFLPVLAGALQSGDDAALRAVIGLFEGEGFAVVGADALAPELVPGPGLLAGELGERDRADAGRAAGIVAALGAVDVGQAAVVQQGLCLAVEALPGTDAMLAAVAALPANLRPDPVRGRGLLYKAPKPGQDRRIDLPAIGPETLQNVASAGLGGIVWEAGGAILLDRERLCTEAARQGMFLWARER
ncbi:MAG: LpxI family protein [Paracoccaceae bacterium]